MKYALIYGTLSGAVIAGVITAGLVLGPENSLFSSMWFGYLVMFVALSFVFMGVKRYRDVEKGGVIRFLPALGMGLAIAVVAALAYILVWEIYLASTGYRFMDDMLAAMARNMAAQGKSASRDRGRSWPSRMGAGQLPQPPDPHPDHLPGRSSRSA